MQLITLPKFLAPHDVLNYSYGVELQLKEMLVQYKRKQSLISDFSFNRDEDNTNSHLFAKIDGKFNDKLKYELNIQNVTNDNYLKIHDLKDSTALINDDSTLTTSFKVDNEIDENTNFDSSFKIYENLSKEKDSDRYQYIFPEFNFSKKIQIDNKYNGSFDFLSSGFQKNYDTN